MIKTVQQTNRQFAINAGASWIASLIKTFGQLALLPIMSRLLSPADYGIYSLAFPTIVFFASIADGGLGASLSREDENNVIIWSTAFWVIMGTCLLLAAGVSLSGLLLAKITNQPELLILMPVLAVVLPLVGITLLADARLTRRGNLVFHAVSDLFAFIIGAFLAVLVAIKGGGYWSLAVQYIASFLTRAIVMNMAAGVMPTFVCKPSLLKNHLGIGGGFVLSRTFELSGKIAENALFANYFGIRILGNYTLATQLGRFCCEAVTNPILGAFYARILHESNDQVVMLHAVITRILLLTLFPLTVLIAILSPLIIPIFVGPEWIEASKFLQLMIVPFGLSCIALLTNQVALKHGMSNRTSAVLSISAIVRACIAGLGFLLSPVATVSIIALSYIVQGLLLNFMIPRDLIFSKKKMLQDMFVPTFIIILSASLTYNLLPLSTNNAFEIVPSAIVGLASYIVLIALFCRKIFLNELKVVKSVLMRRALRKVT